MASRFRNLDHTSHKLTEEEEELTGSTQPRLDRAAIREQFRWALLGKNVLVTEPRSQCYHNCTKPLSKLKRTSVIELRVNVPSEGRYLLLRTLELPLEGAHTPMFGTTTVLLAEDHKKDIAICCLFGYILSHFNRLVENILPVNSAFVLKEPLLKPCMDGSLAVVVGSPSDFVIIDRSHVLSADLEILGWRKKLLDNIGSFKVPDLLLVWKEMGRDYFKQGKYEKAIESYNVALNSSEDLNMKSVFHLNLSACYLSMEYFEAALKHAQKTLEIEPNNEKALYRAGKAYYELRQYRKSKQFFEQLLSDNPSNKNALSEKRRCEDRIKEEEGDVDVYRLHKESIQKPLTPLDCGNYIGPVKINSLPSRDSGAFSTSHIKPGTLILLEKSLAFTNIRNVDSGHTLEKYIAHVIGTIIRNPAEFGKKIYSVRSRKPDVDHKQKIFCDEGNRLEPIVDVYRVNHILFTNILTEEHDKFDAVVRQLFVLASCFRHSCVPNCTFTIYNNVIGIRSCVSIEKGEELTIPYLSCFVGHSSRQDFLRLLRFTCKCVFCQLEARDSKHIHERRDDLLDEMRCVHNRTLKGDLAVQKHGEFVQLTRNTYGDRTDLCVCVFEPYFYLAASSMLQGKKHWETRFKIYVEKGLNCIGLSFDGLLKATRGEVPSLPRSAIVTKEIFDYVVLVADKEFRNNHMSEVAKWITVLMYLERLLTGGNMQMLEHRLKEKSYILKVRSPCT